MDLQKKLIENYLPLINDKLKVDFYERVKVFHEIITSDEENIDFFNSPTKFLSEKDIISIDHVIDEEGNRIEIYNDSELITSLRGLRKLFKETGKITLPNDPILKEIREGHPGILLKGEDVGIREGHPGGLLDRNGGGKTLKKGLDSNDSGTQLDTSNIEA